MDQSLGGIPGEVLEIVIRYCFQGSFPHSRYGIVHVLCVCREWFAVGLKVIWTNVVFRNSTLTGFTSIPPNGDFHLVRSCTLLITPVEAQELARNADGSRKPRLEARPIVDRIVNNGSEATKRLWAELRALPRIPGQMTSLTCFSLKVQDYQNRHGPKGFWLRASDLFDILASVPGSVKNLELDTRCYDKHTSELGSQHICSLIANRLSRLEVVRLRLSRFCDQLVTPSWTGQCNLKAVDINLVGPYHWSQNKLCGSESDKPRELHPALLGLHPAPIVRKAVVKALRSIPIVSLERLQVIDAEYSGQSGESMMVCKRDILRNETISCPYENVKDRGRGYWELRLPCPELVLDGTVIDATNDDTEDDSRMVRSASWVGHTWHLDDPVEGQTWVQTTEGPRFPTQYAYSPAGRQHDYIEDEMRTQEDLLGMFSKAEEAPDLWKREAASGRQLFQARITNGVGDVPPLAREVWKFEGEDDEEERFDDEDEDGGEDGEQDLSNEEDEGDREEGQDGS